MKADDDELLLGGNVAKLSTLKVSNEFKGNRYGELLLKAVFRHAHDQTRDALWLTVYPKHSELITLLTDFGFQEEGVHGTGELRLVKRLRPGITPVPSTPLEYHIAFGPPALRPAEDQIFVVPIQPRYHRTLFPDAPEHGQLSLEGVDLSPRPHGNALRKAYLCHANTRQARPGATLLFYRSHDTRGITVVGVLESQLVSEDHEELLAFVGTRTVYSSAEVEAMTRRGPVLALLFRQDRFVDPPISRAEMLNSGLVRGTPQTVIRANQEATAWLLRRIDD